MEYISAEMRQRHDYVDKVIGFTKTMVNDAVIGEFLPRDFVASYNMMSETYFVPNVRDGIIELTAAQIEAEGHAIIAAERDERIGLGTTFAGFSPVQRERFGQQAREWGLEDDAEIQKFTRYMESALKQSADINRKKPSLHESVALASTMSISQIIYHPDHEDTVMVGGRDVLVFGMPPSGNAVLDETYVVHEHVHQTQFESPVMVVQDGVAGIHSEVFSTEIDAYRVQTDFLTGKERDGYELTYADRIAAEASEIIPHMITDAKTHEVNPRDLFCNWIIARSKELYLAK